MRSILNKLVLVPAVAAVAALASNAAMAETLLKVPFNFTVAGKVCPAGTYSVERDRIGTLVTLKSMDAPRTFSWAVGPGDPAPSDARVVLSFDEQGQMHALRSVQYGARITARLDHKTHQPERAPMMVTEGQ
jgi:hypothetical protein